MQADGGQIETWKVRSFHSTNPGQYQSRESRAAHDPTQLETPFDFDRLEAGVAGSTAL